MPESIDALRESYLRFFEHQKHVQVPSAALVPENDPTTLFTGSGMQPMVPYLLGQPHPAGKRLTNSQKSFRVNDIEEIGDNRHTTFFEMLGNWSFGDYFKKEQIHWIFTFLTQEVGLDPQRLYVTAFIGNAKLNIPRDEESVAIWKEVFANAGIEALVIDNAQEKGLQGGRIFYYDETKNWWSRAGVPTAMPIGEPGGPDSEVFWDFGAERKLHETSPYAAAPCHVNCDCGRFLEIGNNVFMQYHKTAEGFALLPQKNVDFGGGLERIMAASQDDPDIFNLSVFAPAKDLLEKQALAPYGRDERSTKAFRVILDHLRAVTFLMSDGVLPTNKDQGYFVRRLIRRALRFGDTLGIHDFCAPVADTFIGQYATAYPSLHKNRTMILEALTQEEHKFRRTLTSGLKRFEQIVSTKKPGETLVADEVFELYQSFGFPLEMSQELAAERNLTLDTEGFKQALLNHQNRSRQGAQARFKGGLADHSTESIHYHTATHLLHQALRTILGPQVVQKGSNITKDRLRFDFAYDKKVTPEELQQVEALVNAKIQEDLPVKREEMSVAAARKKQALGLFGHKYGETVSVYSIGDFSCEICGGPHVEHTGVLGTFRITKEEAVSAGVRRIKAILTPRE